ncbi:hypothetical protein SAMN04489724_0550 [Algoriphagus locisalis]|uniref:Long-chain fatty acid transport protein n=1 Tax=Algoriphagus locisalis TaxID=305507 RepID=A0A1I6XM38_9BACT|nr:hypothetical protein [Algoriphagus locisalis]SFT39112.1 hypothetical protein SAMN04489724_0550 [Algoriphagus locisalis]
MGTLHLRKTSFLFFLILGIAFTLQAQDTHHWSNQFGTRAALLGGAVLTDTVDNAGVFYNPGNLGYLDTTSLSINANLYGLENITIENALGQRADFKGIQFNTIPLLISGSIQTKSDWNVSYGLLTPVSFNFNGVARIEGQYELASEDISPGQEDLVSESGIITKVQETTVALGIGKKLSPNLGFGISLLNTLRTLNYSYRFSAKALTNSDDYFLISRTQNEFINYFAARTSLKLGLNYQKGTYGLGLAITTPGLDWLGNGTVAEDLTLSNLIVPGIENPVTAYASDRQEKLKTTYKSPFEIAVGAHKTFNRSVLSINITHFGGVDNYRIISAESGTLVRPDNIGQAFDSEDFLNVETAMKPVTNFSIGYENQLKERLKLLGSFRTDFSYFDEGSVQRNQLNTEITQWDIYHVSFGAEIKKSRSSLTLGLMYSFGSTQEYLQRGSFNNVEADQLLEGALVITKAGYSNIGLLVGYAFNFKKFN